MMQVSSSSSSLEGIEAYIQSVVQEWRVPGVGIGVIKDGEIILARGFGKRNVAADLEVTPQTLFAIGSCSKAFTAAAAAILVDEGKLAWDTPVREYYPAFKLADPFATERTTIRDMLCHRTGLARYDMAWHNSPASRKAIVESLQYCEANHDFRSVWQYQNMMYATVGYLIEVISGQTWEEFVQQRILEPLGMSSTNFSVHVSQQSADFALPYQEIRGQIEPTAFFERFEGMGPAGSINSNVLDIARWIRCFLSKGTYGADRRLVSEAQFSQLIQPHMVVPGHPMLPKQPEEFYNTYALGWLVSSYRGHTVVSHTGGIDGFTCQISFLPDDGIGTIVLTNQYSQTSQALRVLTFTLFDRTLGLSALPWDERARQDVSKIKEVLEKSKEGSGAEGAAETPLTHALSAYTGEYVHPGFGTFSIVQEGEDLKGLFNEKEFVLKHLYYNVFQASQEMFDFHCKVAFSINLKGEIESFSIGFEPEAKPLVFTRPDSKQDA